MNVLCIYLYMLLCFVCRRECVCGCMCVCASVRFCGCQCACVSVLHIYTIYISITIMYGLLLLALQYVSRIFHLI